MLIEYNGSRFDLSKPIDISTPLHTGEPQINCYSAPPFATAPVVLGNFIGDIKQGGLLNYKNVFLNPHGNGTHTECVAHIADLPVTINQVLKQFHCIATLITITPQLQQNGDHMITREQVEEKYREDTSALIIRTQPNTSEKLSRNYNNTNPAYLHHDAAAFIRDQNVQHLLIDLPSLDREEDGGKLLAHRAFWHYPEKTRTEATITELIYVDDVIADGIYLLNLQIAAFELDAAPSKPVLFARN